MPRSDIRDVVREAVLWANGQPIFENMDTNYGFEDGRFHIEGDYHSPDGQLRHGFLDLAFSVQQGDLQVIIVEHNIEGFNDEVEGLNTSLSAKLVQRVEDTLDLEVIEFREIEPLASNILQISFTTQIDPDSKVVPLSRQ